jgi:Ca2+:H+ antiporter
MRTLIQSKLPKSTKSSKQTTQSQKHVAVFFSTFGQIFIQSWLNILLIFVPFGIASNAAGLEPIVIFGLNALAIVPLTGLLTFATENVAQSLGVGAGALLNITFGNMVEFIIL